MIKRLLFGINLVSCLLSAEAEEAEKPNILFVLVDDLAWSDVGCYGSPGYETPNIDRLAVEGLKFTQFYSGGPVCSPTRASILTGKSTARTGVTWYLLTEGRDRRAGVTPHLPLEEVTIAEAFREHGYATGYFGKWHLGYRREHWADRQGFEIAVGGMDLAHAWRDCWPERTPPPLDRAKDKHTRFFSPHHLTHMENGPEGEYLTDRLTDETIRFVTEERDQPFFAFLSFHTVHTPLQAKPEAIEKQVKRIAALGLNQKNEPNKRFKQFQNNPNYAAMVQHLDENVGRLLKSLRDSDLEKETIVVFTSDNGGKGSVTSNLPLAGAKHDLREGGIRVPCIVRWPGRIPAGEVSDLPCISDDFYPTLHSLAGLPPKPNQHVDGNDLSAHLSGSDPGDGKRMLFWHYPHSRTEGAVRHGDFKLNYFYKSGEARLYDLKSDPGEREDLAESDPGRVETMKRALFSWLEETGARYPEGFTPILK